ncbi:MAG: mucoidy inhibitor MuiA family protein, partial [Sphingobacteriales bacterium]
AKTIAKRIDAVARQLQEFNNHPNQPTGEVLITVSATQRTQAEFTITYVAANAGWNPVYDLRASDTNSPVKLVYKANVYQQTGLDWKKVKLKLTSGNPSAGSTKPELSTWHLNVYDNRPRKRQARVANLKEEEKAAGLTDNFGGWGSDASPSQTMGDYTQVSESVLAVEFTITIPYTIPSDGKERPIELQQHELKAVYQHMAVPKLDPRAFLVARITGWDEYNLLPGAVNAYFAGTFVRHPLALAAAKASLLHLKAAGPGLQKALTDKAQRVATALNTELERHQIPLFVAQFGSLWRIKAQEEVPYSELLFTLLRQKGFHIWDGFPCFITEAHTD